ncbi:MAG: TlpA family protein disulfide reductase [Bacteroidales bacterium]|nr:TlpA family protein disulfide reductase [Bacteroidales bacterium]
MPETSSSPELPDINGKMVSVSSLKGKYVLVSFWSTTSEESMNQLPVLRSIYNDYHRKGLEIYQISLDPDAERWKNVVRYEEIPWISVREPDPENPVYARLMNITYLPSNLLYDPAGQYNKHQPDRAQSAYQDGPVIQQTEVIWKPGKHILPLTFT